MHQATEVDTDAESRVCPNFEEHGQPDSNISLAVAIDLKSQNQRLFLVASWCAYIVRLEAVAIRCGEGPIIDVADKAMRLAFLVALPASDIASLDRRRDASSDHRVYSRYSSRTRASKGEEQGCLRDEP